MNDMGNLQSASFSEVLPSAQPASQVPVPLQGLIASGCLRADTLIRLTTGEVLGFADLLLGQALRKKFFGYAIQPSGTVITVPFKHIRITQRCAPLMRVTLSNHKFVDCTPEHPFYLKTKQVVQARDLFVGSSLLTVAPEIVVKVVDISPLRDRYDVYDLDVPEFHNFLLGCGIFVRTGSH